MPDPTVQQLIANAKTVDKLPEALALEAEGYFVFYLPGIGLRKIKKGNIVFAGEPPTKSTHLTDMPSILTGQAGKILVVTGIGTYELRLLSEVQGVTKAIIEEALNYTPVKSVNNVTADANGNVTIDISSGGSSNLTELISFASGWEQGTLNYQPVADWKKDGVLDSFTGARTLVPDPSLPMYALWYIDLTTGTVEIKYGQPSANPEKPTVDDPVNHLDTGAFVHLAAGATVPSDVSGETIYAEGGEWAISGTGTINTTSTDTPHGGTNNLHAVLTTGQYIQFTAPSARETSGKELAYWIDNITGGSHSIVFIGTLAKNGKTGSVTVGSPGVYKPSITTWQAQSLPLPSELTNITAFRIVAGANIEIKLDDMRLISGGGVVIVEGVTKEYVLAEDAKRLDLRASNLASDLSEAEKTAIKNKLGVVEGGDGTGSGVTKRYLTWAALLADQAAHVDLGIYYAADASGHSEVETAGTYAYFEYKGTVNGTEADYRKLSEEESMDVAAVGGGVSSDPDNDLTTGGDGKPYYNAPVYNGGSGEILYNVKNYGVKGDGIDLIDGNITSGTNVFTSSAGSFQASDVGKVIAILGAVTGGGFLVSTITGFTDANTVTIATNATVTVSGAKFYYGTDDTVAIQTLLQTVFDVGGGVVYFPKSVYVIAGALQTSVGAYNVNPNSQLWIPYDNSEFTDLRGRAVIELRGEVSPSLDSGSGLATRVASNKGTVLRSTIQGSGIDPSVIANRGGAPNDNNNGKSRTNLVVKNLQIQITANADRKITIGGINANHSNNLNAEYVAVTPYALRLDSEELAKPDAIDCTGIIMPGWWCDLVNTLRNCVSVGFTHGFKLGEHTAVYQANSIGCIYGFGLVKSSQTITAEQLCTHWCMYDFNFPTGAGDTVYFIVHFMQAEWLVQGKWFDYVACINDPSNNGIGSIKFNAVETPGGMNVGGYKKIGGNKITATPVSVDPINTFSNITAYTLKHTDCVRLIDCFNNTGAMTITVPNSSTVTFDINTRIVINRNGPDNLILQGAAGVTLQYPARFIPYVREQFDAVELVYRGNNNWALYGALKSV